MQPTYYSAFDVLKTYLKNNNYTIVNFELMEQRPDNVLVWVDENNAQKATHFVCEKNSPVQFLIWAYNSDGEQVIHTSISYAKPSKL